MAAIQTRTRDIDFGSFIRQIVARVDGRLQVWLGLQRQHLLLEGLLFRGLLLPAVAAGARYPSLAIQTRAFGGLKRMAGNATGELEPMCSSHTRSRRRTWPVTLR